MSLKQKLAKGLAIAGVASLPITFWGGSIYLAANKPSPPSQETLYGLEVLDKMGNLLEDSQEYQRLKQAYESLCVHKKIGEHLAAQEKYDRKRDKFCLGFIVSSMAFLAGAGHLSKKRDHYFLE